MKAYIMTLSDRAAERKRARERVMELGHAGKGGGCHALRGGGAGGRKGGREEMRTRERARALACASEREREREKRTERRERATASIEARPSPKSAGPPITPLVAFTAQRTSKKKMIFFKKELEKKFCTT